jgi:sulfate adenylyltransferase
MPHPHGNTLIHQVLDDRERQHALETAETLQRIDVTEATARDIENLATGVFSPLTGFMTQDQLDTVLHLMRLPNDLAWTIPVLLDVTDRQADPLEKGTDVALYVHDKPLAIMHLAEKYRVDKSELAAQTFGTTDPAHPGVAAVHQMGDVCLGGPVDLIQAPPGPYDRYKLTPVETRVLFQEKGWHTVVGFQTRNPPHLGHEYVQKTALAFVDGVFVNPVIGKKKSGDFQDDVILDAYTALMENYYLKDSIVMSILPFEMRYAGPREAIFHAIVRKNFGCTHFIVGRDHAGVGTFYGPYDAQQIFDDFPDLGITPLFFKSFFHCKRCGMVTNEKACPHSDADHINFSGSKIRELLATGHVPPKELMRPEVAHVITRHPHPFVD